MQHRYTDLKVRLCKAKNYLLYFKGKFKDKNFSKLRHGEHKKRKEDPEKKKKKN